MLMNKIKIKHIIIIVIRLFTRWYSVAVGFVALKLSGGLTFADEQNEK